MNLLEQLKTGVLLADGAWGTEFAKLGHSAGECPELLNVNHPDIVLRVAGSYVDAGSDIILTNTFGGTPFSLDRYGLADRTEELSERGAALSRKAAGDRVLVAAALGPTGQFLEPLGTVTRVEMVEAFARQVRAFVRGGADAVVIETMSDLEETVCAIEAVRAESGLPVIACMTYEKGLHGFATMMGVRPERAVPRLEEAGADLVGSNCGAGIATMIALTPELCASSTKPLWIKPNAGMPVLDDDGRTIYRESPDAMAGRIPELIGHGARVVGGCCGTTPEHIRAFRKVIDAL